MKRILFFITFIIIALAKDLAASSPAAAPAAAASSSSCSQETDKVIVVPNETINMSKELYLNARSQSQAEKASLFSRANQEFPLEKAVSTAQNIPGNNKNFVFWMTNYFGRVMNKSVKWHKSNIWDQVPNGTFWLTNLNAWAFINVDEQDLKKSPHAAKVDKIKRGETLSEKECPLTNPGENPVLGQGINATQNYRLVASSAFFTWLKNQPPDLLDDETIDSLCKEDARPGRLPCTLRQIGYEAPILSRSLKRLDGKNMLDVAPSRVNRPLQFFEGVYIAAQIIKAREKDKEPSSVGFVTPNKEFTYSLVPGEKQPFATFQTCVNKVLQREGYTGKPATVYQLPFAYGDSILDAPYRETSGNPLKQAGLLELLKEEKK